MVLADNNLSKNIKIGIDVELNKRSVDEVTRQIAQLSKGSITLRGVSQPVTPQDFSAKLFQSFFDRNSKISTKQIIDMLPTKELKKAAGEMVEIFKDVKEQLRDVGQQLKFDQNSKGTGSARFITAPLGQGRPTKSDTYFGRTVVSADFDKLVNEVKKLRGKDGYTSLGSAARGTMEIEGLRQLVLQEIERLVGGSVGSGVKVAGLAQYLKPMQQGLSAVQETEFGLSAVKSDLREVSDTFHGLTDIMHDSEPEVQKFGKSAKDFTDALEGLDDATAATIIELNKNAKNIAKLIGLKDLPTKIDPREAGDPEELNNFYARLRRGDKAGIRSNIGTFADFAPARGGSIGVSPALLEMAFENVITRIAPGTRVPGGDIVEAKTAEALAKIAPILDAINARLFDQNIGNVNSGRIWGTPEAVIPFRGSIIERAYQGPVGQNGENALPKPKQYISGDGLGYQVAPYGVDSMRKLAKFIGENPEAYAKFQEKVFNDIMQGALDAAMEAEQKQVDQLSGGDFSGGEEIQHGVNYIVDGINNAVLQYEQQMGLELGTIFHSIGSTPSAELRDKLETYFLKNIQTNIVGNLGSVLGQPFRESVTDTLMTFDTYQSEGSASYRASRVPYSQKEIESINNQIIEMQKGIQSYKEKIKETEAELKGAKSEDVMLQLSDIIVNYTKGIADFEDKITKLQLKGLAGKFIPAASVDLERVDPTKLISTQMLFRPEFLKQAKITSGIQDMMMQIMAAVPKQVEEAVEPAVTEAVQQVEATDPFAAIFAKYEGLGLGGVIQKLREALRNAGDDASQLVVGFDTEFNQALATPINELSLVMRDAFGKSEELFSFFHRPAALESIGGGKFKELTRAQLDYSFSQAQAGPTSVKAIEENAAKAGFDLSKLGSDDVGQNLALYQKKIKSVNALLAMLEELNIAVAGNNLANAEFASILKSAQYLNSLAQQFGLDPVVLKNSLNNLVDVYAIAKKLQSAGVSSPELQNILAKLPDPDKDGGKSGLKLGELIAKVVRTMPGALPEANVVDGQVTGINGQPFHVAKADATASAALHELFKKAFADYAAMASMTQAWASHASYGPGAMLYPYSKKTRAGNPAAFQQQPQLDIPETTEAPSAAFNAEARQEMAKTTQSAEKVADAQEKQAVATETTTKSLAEQTKEAAKSTKEWKDYERKIVAAQNAIDPLNEALRVGTDLTKEQKHEILRERSRLATDIYEAKQAQEKIEKLAQQQVTNEDYLKELRRAPYDTLATQQLTGGGSVVRNIDKGRVGPGFGGAGRPPGGNGYITERGGEFLGPDPKATRDASEQIKRQLKDQVEASKEAEKANKSLISTWISGRYALYDVGNSFQNVAQQAFRFTQQIFRLTDSYRNYETAFTSVDRAMQLLGDEVQGMQKMFVDLSETMPISFEQLTAIGTLGAQMGVTADGIKNFTEVVAKFSSVTGISAETTAQKFGRIAELANVDYSQFENLGSAVAYAGVNAVATEAEILSLTESIAAVSEQAGFAPEEIVGLSTAIASLGIAPEQARGVFTRVFADINRAVNKGGEELQNFGKISGMSGEEFAATWADSDGGASRAFQAMLLGLKTTGNMTKAFDALNITETREVNTLTRLAENLDVVESSMSDASMAFEDATFLGDSFEKTVDNLDSKIQLFQNNFKSAMQSVALGVSQGFGAFLDVASKFLEFTKRMADGSQILGPAITAIFGVSGIIGVGAGAISVVTKVLAQIYALRVAMINTANDPNMVQGFSKNFKALTNFGAALVEDHSNLTVLNGKMGELTQVTYSASAAFAKLRGDSSKMFSELLGKDIYMSTGAGLAEAQGVDLAKASDSKRVELARREAQGVSQVVEARKKLLEVMENELPWDEANRARSAATLEAARAEQIYLYTTTEGIKAVDLDTQMKLKNATAAEIEASAELKAAQANIANANANRAGAAAVNTNTKAQSMASKGALGFGAAMSAALGPISIIITAISLLAIAYEAIATAIKEANTVHLFEDQGGTAAIREAIYKDTLAWKENGEAIATATSKVVDNRKEVPAYKSALIAAAKGQEALKTATEDTTKKIEEQTLAIGQNTKELLAKALYENQEIQAAFKQYPEIFSTIESAGVNVSDLLEKMLDPNVSGAELIAELETIKNTVATTNPEAFKNALSVLQQAIQDTKAGIDDALSQSKLVTSIKKMLGITEELDDTVESVGNNVRTVIDYANDLSGVFERIQQISLERLTARDSVVTGWRNIREAAISARDAVKAANQEISDLSSDQAMLQYQYDVAKRYGDERRMAILQGKMTANQEKLADATKKRNESEDQASMTLMGSSKAAIANRASLSGMVDGYQNYVLALVRAGVKGKELQDAVDNAKDSFIRNGESVGFSKDELGKYIDMFDNFLTAIKRTPRNVTVEFIAEMSAAENALREFLAKANNSKATVKIEADMPNLGGNNIDANGNPILYGDSGYVKPGIAPSPTNGSFVMGPEWFVSPSNQRISPELAAKARAWGSKYSPAQLKALLNTRAARVYKGNYGFKDNVNTGGAYQDALDSGLAFKTDQKGLYTWLQYLESINWNKKDSPYFAAGGYVSGKGTGTSDSIPAMLSNGEYVITAKATSAYGADFMNALNQQRVTFAQPQSMSQNGNNSPTMVYLSPEDRALLRAAVERPVELYTENTKIAQSANAGNVILAQRGMR